MPLTPADVHNVAFSKPPIGKRGYNEDEVDAFLDLVEAELARLIEENEDLREQVSQLEQRLGNAQADLEDARSRPPDAGMGGPGGGPGLAPPTQQIQRQVEPPPMRMEPTRAMGGPPMGGPPRGGFGGGFGRGPMTPEQQADRTTQRMTQALGLNAAQQKKIHDITLHAAMENKKIRDAQTAAIKRVLTPDQQKKMDAMRGPGGGMGGGRRG